jgi:hypothetical protein
MNAERYRSKAQHYLLCARQMTDPNAKAALLDVAAHWMQMARQWEDENERAVQNQRQAQARQEGVVGGKGKTLPE